MNETIRDRNVRCLMRQIGKKRICIVCGGKLPPDNVGTHCHEKCETNASTGSK